MLKTYSVTELNILQADQFISYLIYLIYITAATDTFVQEKQPANRPHLQHLPGDLPVAVQGEITLLILVLGLPESLFIPLFLIINDIVEISNYHQSQYRNMCLTDQMQAICLITEISKCDPNLIKYWFKNSICIQYLTKYGFLWFTM